MYMCTKHVANLNKIEGSHIDLHVKISPSLKDPREKLFFLFSAISKKFFVGVV